MSVHLFDLASEGEIGVLTDEQFQFLQERLASEDVDDDDYYLNRDTLDALEQEGADADVIALLRRAMGDRTDMDVRWQR